MSINDANLSNRIRSTTAELRDLEQRIKTEQAVDINALGEFREALDSARMTAWTVNEWHQVRQTKFDSDAVALYLVSERMRRFTQMAKDLGIDLENCDLTVQTPGIRPLFDSVNALHARLSKVVG
jgi:hypothetical protein